MARAAFLCGWYVGTDPTLPGRVVRNDVIDALDTLPHGPWSTIYPEARKDNGEPTRGAVVVIVEAPDATLSALASLPRVRRFPANPRAIDKDRIEAFLAERGINVSLSSATTVRDLAERVARALHPSFVALPPEVTLD